MHIFTYDGISSEDYNVAVSGENTWQKPKPIYERVTIPGRNGEYVSFTGAYENTSVPYRCIITKDFDAYFTAFINKLLANPRYKRLEDTYHSEYYRFAVVESIGNPTFAKYRRAGEFEVVFTCKPQTYLKSGENKWTFTSGGNIVNPTPFESKPILRVYGVGQFGIGGNTVTITAANGYTDFDCETENAYKDDTSNNCNSNIVLTGDHFPTLAGGANGVSLGSGITKIEIVPRWWQL